MKDSSEENSKLRMVLKVTRQMAVTTNLDSLLNTIISAACNVLECERATIFLYDAEHHQLYSRAATGEAEIRIPADAGIAGAAARDRIAINVSDAYADKRFNPEVDKQTGFRTRNLLTFPLENIDGDLIGVLQALNRRGRAFDEADIELANVLSAQAGVALQRWFLIEEYAQKQRMARDLHIARNIQQALFPKTPPQLAGYEIAGFNCPADETGGDCYDFITLPDGRLAVLLADATGHGIGAALVIAQCRSLVRAMLSVTDDLPRVAAGVNKLLTQDLTPDIFVTAFFGIVTPDSDELHYISGGQGPLVHIAADGTVEQRRASGVPFALDEDMPYDPPDPFIMKPGSLLLVMTDGFYEATDRKNTLFGSDRVIEFVKSCRDSPPAETLSRLYEEVRAYSGQKPQADDLTAVLIRRTN